MILYHLIKKNKVVSTRRIGGKGIVKLIMNYDVEKENGKNAIVSANAGVYEQNIPDNYNVYVDNTECVISSNKKRSENTFRNRLVTSWVLCS